MMRTPFVIAAFYAATASTWAQGTEPAHKTVLLSGCLQASEGAEPIFKLTNTAIVSRTTPEQVSSPPAVGTAGETPANPRTEYELRPARGVSEPGVNAKELQRHAGMMVHIAARPVEQPAPATPSAPRTAEQQPKPPETDKVRLTVTEIKPLGSKCS